MKTILVTGGAGFIGSHTCLALLEQGYNVISIDSYINSSPIALKRVKEIYDSKQLKNKSYFKVIKDDIRNTERLDTIFSEAKNNGRPINGVIHFAGLKSVKESVENPLLYWDTNLNSTISLLKAMEKNDCNTIVFSSSATVYGAGSNNNNLISEDAEINPINSYGTTKYAIEMLLNDINNSANQKWRIANLRYFNPIGAHNSGLIGENPLGLANNIFPLILDVASGKSKKLKVFGDDWPTFDGTGVRDYIHVVDLAEGHISTLRYLFQKKSKVLNLNLGTGLGTSVLELINTFSKVNQVEVPYSFFNRRSGDVPYLVADNSLAKKLLNWSPVRSLENMCIDGWKWKMLNPRGYF